MIEVTGLKKKFGHTRALQGIDFQVRDREVVGFLGPNGAGKTTTMRILTGFFQADEGQAVVAGLDVSQHSYTVRQKIGYLPENNPLWEDLEVTESLRFHAQLRRIPKKRIQNQLESVISRCGLSQVVGRKISELSKGFRQRLGLAQAMIHDPEILILDEPTSGLDPHQIIEIRNLIREIGKEKTVLLSSHILPEVEVTCGRIIILHQGKTVASGTPAELASKAKERKGYEVKIRGNLEEIKKGFLASIPLADLSVEGSTDSVHTLRLNSPSEEDLGEKIFKIASDRGFALTELKKEESSLEDVFLKLTGTQEI
jgi:ABC-2 type transport system ATP-binding protein